MVDDHTVVGRTVAILDCVTDAVSPLPLAMLTRRTGIPKATARRIAKDLVERGMLAHTPDGYLPGQRLIHQGLVSAHRDGAAVTVQPYLQDLHWRTRGQSAWYARVHEGELVIAGAAFGRQQAADWAKPWFPTMSKLGPSRVLLAAGRIEVAHNPELADQILHCGWTPMTRHSTIDRGRMRRLIVEARDTGFAHEIEETQLGTSCMGAALRDPSGRLVGAIGVSGRCAAIEAGGVRAVLTRSAELLQHELRSVTRNQSADVLRNVPTFNRRNGIGYTWPTVNDPSPRGPMVPMNGTE